MLVINKIILNLIVMPSRCSVSPWLHRLVFGVNNYEKKKTGGSDTSHKEWFPTGEKEKKGNKEKKKGFSLLSWFAYYLRGSNLVNMQST